MFKYLYTHQHMFLWIIAIIVCLVTETVYFYVGTNLYKYEVSEMKNVWFGSTIKCTPSVIIDSIF